MSPLSFLVATLALWRLTHLLNAEAGPWNLLARLRLFAGQSIAGQLLDCFYCLSLWIAAPVALLLHPSGKSALLLWPALSAGAILAERLTSPPSAGIATPITYYEQPEESYVLRTE